MRPTPRWGRWLPGMKAVGRRDDPTAWFRLEEELEHLTGEWADATPDHDPRSGSLFHRCIATGTTEVEALVNALHAA